MKDEPAKPYDPELDEMAKAKAPAPAAPAATTAPEAQETAPGDKPTAQKAKAPPPTPPKAASTSSNGPPGFGGGVLWRLGEESDDAMRNAPRLPTVAEEDEQTPFPESQALGDDDANDQPICVDEQPAKRAKKE